MSKQSLLDHFDSLKRQAEFDGDGNAAAMFQGLYLDVQSVLPDSAFELRETFMSGAEAEARAAEAAPVSPIPAAEPEPVASVSTPDAQPDASGDAPGPADAPADAPLTVAPPAEIPSGKPVAEVQAEGAPTETATPALTDAEHEAKQDADIAELKAIAAKHAPQT